MDKAIAKEKMDNKISDIIEEIWAARFLSLKKRVEETVPEIGKLLILEDHYRHGHKDQSRLRESFGEFSAPLFDVGAMSSLLTHGDEKRSMGEERFKRVKRIAKDLVRITKGFSKSPPRWEMVSIEKDSQEVLETFENCANAVAEIFRVLRIARLELTAEYDPGRHDDFFKKFSWRSLESSEAALCPPFVVLAAQEENDEEFFYKLLQLVPSGRPIKVVALCSQFRPLSKDLREKGRAAALKCSFAIETLPLFLSKVYVAQCSPADDAKFRENVQAALDSPRPAVISVFAPASESDRDFEDRSRRAILSRAFPQFAYDPDRSTGFVANLQLLENPEEEKVWAKSKLEVPSENGEPAYLEHGFTFADFLAGEEKVEDHFEVLSSDEQSQQAVLLPDYLDLPPSERGRRRAFIYSKDEDGHLTKLAPSRDVIAHTAWKMDLWQILQELSGASNPHVRAAKKEIEDRLSAEKEEALAALRSEMEGSIQNREREAVKTAMKNLALKLSGMTGSVSQLAAGISSAPTGSVPVPDSSSVPAAEGSGASGAEELGADQDADVSELPWIETEDCTSCDDCITINKKVFAYNEDKKCVIKDPRGGPYRDIVKAAEICPALVIHPGKPLDPNEKDLEKWIKRAEKYQ